MKKIKSNYTILATALCLILSLTLKTAQGNDTTIFKSIDLNQTYRQFPNLVTYFNTSLQKAPAPILAEVAAKEFGIPEITRCWLNLDEMWDYRTKKYNFNYRIGVDRYKDIKEKHRETWNWEKESNVMYYDYLNAFSNNSKEIMLTIRRYEKDINTGSLPITMKDWKTIFKTGLKHYKMKYPNIRYVEVCNEYELKGFMDGTNDQYYEFYKLGYEAVNEINKELNLTGKDQILVGGPVTTGNSLPRIEAMAQNFIKDKNPTKRIDFISWHEYTKPLEGTAHRQASVRAILKKYGINEHLPMFISEHDPFHYKEDSEERHFSNSSTLIKSLYFTNLYSPNIIIMPWVLYHVEGLQTRFMWFKGPNEPNTQAHELKMLPTGISMKLLSKHTGKEVKVQNDVNDKEIILVSKDNNKLIVHVVNYDNKRPVQIILKDVIKNIGKKYTLNKYVLDSKHNNAFSNTSSGRLDITKTENVNNNDSNTMLLQHNNLEKYGTVVWEFIW